MKRKILSGFCLLSFLLFGIAGVSQAALTIIGTASYNGSDYNLIYDADGPSGPITWLDYSHSEAQWVDQIVWAATLGQYLTVELDPGYTTTIDWSVGWRLPSAGTNPQKGYSQTTSEMGHLFYEENILEFTELFGSGYWSGTAYASMGGLAWDFYMADGHQNYSGMMVESYGLAVRSGGTVSAVPIPGAIWLLGSGLLAMVGIRRRKHHH